MTTPKIPDLSGLHPHISKQMVRDMWSNFHKPDSGWSTTINLNYEQNPLYHAMKVFKWSEAQVNEVWKALGWGTPYPNPSNPSTLKVIGGKLTYGNTTKFCGVSRREILQRAKGEYGGLSPNYTLADYERDIIDSGINYVRHIGVLDTPFLKAHCERMGKEKIIVEVEVYDESEVGNNPWVDIDSMAEIAQLGNVLFGFNEFMDHDSVDRVINYITRLKGQGCIVSAGAWGHSNHGEDYSRVFHDKCDLHDIEMLHRYWTTQSFNDSLALGKPVNFNEFFSYGEDPQMDLERVKSLMKEAFDMGLNVCYYGFRDERLHLPGLTIFDPFDYRSILTYAGDLLR